MKKCFIIGVLLIAVAFLAIAGGATQTAPATTPATPDAAPVLRPVNLVYSTHGVGTGMYQATAAMVPLMEAALPAGSRIDVETTGGGVSGPLLVGTGKADIAVGNVNTIRWLWDGTLEGQPKIDGFRAIAGGWDNPMSTVIFTEDFIRRTGYTSIEDIVRNRHPVRISIKTVGTLGEHITRLIFEAYGATLDEVKSWGGQVHNVATADIVSMLRDNRADITIDHVSVGQAATSELALTTAIRFISLSTEVQNKLVNTGFARRTIEPGTWARQNYPVVAVSAPLTLLVSKDMDEEVAYRITKAIIENKAAMVAANNALEVFDPATAWQPDKVQIPLHPGAERYYREAGTMR